MRLIIRLKMEKLFLQVLIKNNKGCHFLRTPFLCFYNIQLVSKVSVLKVLFLFQFNKKKNQFDLRSFILYNNISLIKFIKNNKRFP